MLSGEAFQKFLFLLPLAYPTTGPTIGSSSIYEIVEASSDWSYNNTESWGNDYPQCNGYRQSPIHLRTNAALAATISPLRFGNYDVPLPAPISLVNNGHSIQLTIPELQNGARPYISGGILTSKYEAQSLHFHWGSKGERGSEHVINDRRYDVEMHIVHKNVNYGTMDEATQHRDGLAVLGIMFKIINEPDREYPGLNKVFTLLPSLTQYQSQATINRPVTLAHFLGDLNTKNFYTYSGSLTTPPCSESVTWQVFPDPLPIARANIMKFWDILDSHADPLLNNYRPLQAGNLRPVFYRSLPV